MKENFGIYSDADGYALDTNIHRRHLRPGARHLVMEMARRRKKENGQMPITKKDMAKQAEVEVGELVDAGFVIQYSPDLIPDVLSGRMGLQAAADVAREFAIAESAAYITGTARPYRARNARDHGCNRRGIGRSV